MAHIVQGKFVLHFILIAMKLSSLLTTSVAILSLSAISAHANVVHNLSLDFQSGAQYTGTVTFKDDYSSLLGTQGILSGGDYGTISMGWRRAGAPTQPVRFALIAQHAVQLGA